MSPPTMVFHSPRPVEAEPKAGSTAHVTRMAEGFRDIGYDVEFVAGFSHERSASMRRVRDLLRGGRTIEFVYSEASTAPTSMNDPHHLPLRPLIDWRFLRSLRRAGVPVGLFYPDVYWRFPVYRETVGPLRRLPALAMYRFDLLWYRDALDVLFLPSRRMAASVPGWADSPRVEALEPGGSSRPIDWHRRDTGLDLFYVGSVMPPLYDIRSLLEAVTKAPGVHLTVCCPADQVEALRGADPDQVTIVHEHGEALTRRYAACDAACLVFAADPYRAFAMPVKLFEAIGAGRPVLASGGTAVGDFVARTGTGWVVEPDDLAPLLRRLAASPELIRERRDEVLAQLPKHTWAERARGVADLLTEASRSTDGR